jgi:hypothetical protein
MEMNINGDGQRERERDAGDQVVLSADEKRSRTGGVEVARIREAIVRTRLH